MAGSAVVTGVTVFFTFTTLAVLAYPLIKLAPSWLEHRLNRKIALHRDALVAVETALAVPGHDEARQAKLIARRDVHLGALRSLAAAEAAPTVTGPLPVEIAA